MHYFKKMIALLTVIAMLPINNVMAASQNTITKKVTVKDDEPIGSVFIDENETEAATSGNLYKPIYLKIIPETGIEDNSSIIISIENGKFDEDIYAMPVYTSGAGKSYDYMINEYNSGKNLTQILSENLGTNSLELPYKIISVSKREIEINLFPVEEKDCDKSSNSIAYDKVYYYIPIHAIADGAGDVKITIDDNESGISGGGTYTIANSTEDDGSTTITIDDTTTFRDSTTLENITIKENIKGTFEEGKDITLRLSNDFIFSDSSDTKIILLGGGLEKELDFEYKDSDRIIIHLPEDLSDFANSASRIRIEDLRIEVSEDDEEDNWGEVNLTISGGGVTKDSITIAERADYGFKITTVDEIPTIISGRTWIANKDLDEEDFDTATVKFEETNAGSWLTNRKLKFSVPEGVKIVDYDFDKVKNVSKGDIEDSVTITEDGATLSLLGKDINIVDDECAEFEITLNVSIDADYTGDILLSTSGSGIEGTLDDIEIAEAVTPITISSSTTRANMGYESSPTTDIVISENQAGVLLDGEEIIIGIDSLYGDKEIGFADDNIDYSVDGEIEIKNFEVNDGEITFTIDKDSYNEPSEITISNITIGSTRSVPYGSYDIKVYGSAVVNNYSDDIEDIYPTIGYEMSDKDDKEDVAYFDTTEGYSFPDYFIITTSTGTFDNTVEVTIGSKEIIVNGETQTIEVAPYIQAKSNSTVVPLRFVSTALGDAEVIYNADTKTATIVYDKKIVQFSANSNIMTVDGTAIPMEYGVKAEITQDRMFVPFRALGTALGIPVTWDEETRTAIYN